MLIFILLLLSVLYIILLSVFIECLLLFSSVNETVMYRMF
jgi:hypothetical protein